MATPAPNLVNLEKVSKAYGVRPLLSQVSLGVQRGDRIGVVGRNGDGLSRVFEIRGSASSVGGVLESQ